MQQAGGPKSKQKAEWMVDVTENWFYLNSEIENYEVADYLEQIMHNEFSLSIDDGSLLQVGTYVTEYYKICTTESYSEDTIINFLHHLPKCDISKCRYADEVEEIGAGIASTTTSFMNIGANNDSEEMRDSPEKRKKQREEPVIDEDGFEMVKSKKKKHREEPEVDEDGFEMVKSKKKKKVEPTVGVEVGEPREEGLAREVADSEVQEKENEKVESIGGVEVGIVGELREEGLAQEVVVPEVQEKGITF